MAEAPTETIKPKKTEGHPGTAGAASEIVATEQGAALVSASPHTPQPFVPPAPRARAKLKPIDERRFQERAFRQNCWVVFAENGTTIENILAIDYWANVAAKMRAPDKIILMTDDRRLYAELIVFVVGTNWVETRLLGEPIIVNDITTRGSVANDYVIEDGGLTLKWVIRRRSDGRVVKGDGTLKTEDQARAWLREYLQSQGIRPAA